MKDLQFNCPQHSSYSLRRNALLLVVIALSAMLWEPSSLIAQPDLKADDNAKPKVQWNQFRGSANGHAGPTARPPVDWDADQIAWESQIPGTGLSSPVYQGKQAWLTSAITTPSSKEQDAEKR